MHNFIFIITLVITCFSYFGQANAGVNSITSQSLSLCSKAQESDYGKVKIDNSIEYFYRTQGDRRKPMVLLLHGFPESSLAWTQIMPLLSCHFFVVAPDLQGFGQSTRSSKVEDYNLGELASHNSFIIKHFGKKKATIVGHDWGGTLAWLTGIFYSSVVSKLIVINSSHPTLYYKQYHESPEQFERVDYVRRIKNGEFDAKHFKKTNYEFFSTALWGNPIGKTADFFDDKMKESYYQGWESDTQFSLNYYHVINFPKKEAPYFPFQKEAFSSMKLKDSLPVLSIWGEKDEFAVSELNDGLQQFVPNLKIRSFSENTHWIHHEAPAKVAQEIINFSK